MASYGYDAWGLEVSGHAAEQANNYLGSEKAGVGELEGEYRVKDEAIGKGTMQCVVGDYFKDEWLREAGGDGGFEVIYDNTVSSFLGGEGQWVVACVVLTRLPSSYVHCHRHYDRNGRNERHHSSRQMASLSVSNSRRTSPRHLVDRRGHFRRQFTLSY